MWKKFKAVFGRSLSLKRGLHEKLDLNPMTYDVYRIRFADEGDISALLNLQQLTYGRIMWSRETLYTELLDQPQTLCLLVEDDQGRSVAFLSAWFSDEEGHVSNLCVLPRHQRRGLGRFLMELMVQASCQCQVPKICLEVRRSNVGAIAMYRSFGFYPTAVKKAYYLADGEDALEMTYPLGGDDAHGFL